ncbi:probable pectinesterase/pectinesterase inhibitor 21 [Syzygium oleosum]|uniref:probable pectinesterase/pectinesterase inhibitor 21 n=1 Tax=Syzygium oleosum TaxID=219896 RepID=UPI0024BA13DF|nr:probable pectinesterase/pectinesterase inhibitor 21 [Syzygium oleosum]
MSNDAARKKKVAIAAASALILVVAAVAVVAAVTKSSSGSGDAQGETKQVSATMKAIQAMCQPTDYKEACVKSLETAGPNVTDPKELIKAGFNVAMKKISEAAEKSVTLKELAKDPRTSQALENCKELMEYAIDDLQNSFDKLGALDMSKVDEFLADLKTWLSASITYQETCLDGFENATGDAGEKMRKALNSTAELTSNGLAMVTEISSVLTNLNLNFLSGNRKLLQDTEVEVLGHGEFPLWMDPVKRRLLQAKVGADLKPDLVVAKDGSGKYKTITEALKDIPLKSNNTFVLYIKEGVYREQVIFDKKMTHLVVIGDGPTKTRIVYNSNYVDGVNTFKTATVSALGDYFFAKDIGFENDAGAIKHQAVALRVQSDFSVFYNCHMDGYQDTLYTHAHRQFYRDCTITGTIDFIFGDAGAIFQNCKMLVRRPLDNQQCIVTAQGRKERRQPSAIILQNCTISADASYLPVKDQFRSFLGRPWKQYSRTIIMQSYIDDIIQPEGWLPWLGDFGLNTCFYSEFGNRGPGSSTAGRAKWRGVKTITAEHAADFTAGRFLRGSAWIPKFGVPFTAGMVAV